MTADTRREANGDDRYVRMSDWIAHTDHVLEVLAGHSKRFDTLDGDIGGLTTEVSRLATRLGRAASLPDIQEAIEDEREITEVTHLKAELADAKARAAEDKALASKRRDFWFGMFALAAATAAGSVATAIVLRALHI